MLNAVNALPIGRLGSGYVRTLKTVVYPICTSVQYVQTEGPSIFSQVFPTHTPQDQVRSPFFECSWKALGLTVSIQQRSDVKSTSLDGLSQDHGLDDAERAEWPQASLVHPGSLGTAGAVVVR